MYWTELAIYFVFRILRLLAATCLRKLAVILFIICLGFFYSCLVHRSSRQALYDLQTKPGRSDVTDTIITLPAYDQPQGDSTHGREYLLHGDLFNSGLPYSLYKFIFETSNRRLVSLVGFNKYELNPFTVFSKRWNPGRSRVPGLSRATIQRRIDHRVRE